jgi:ATP-dependent Clp protease ATP-binding subunit ClpA
MDPNKLTAKASEAISAAAEMATEAGNPQLTPIHLAVALFEDPDGLGKQVHFTRSTLRALSDTVESPLRRLTVVVSNALAR